MKKVSKLFGLVLLLAACVFFRPMEAKAAEVVGGHVIGAVNAAMLPADTINVRIGPGTEYPAAGQLTAGQVVNVCGKSDNGWYQVVFGTGIGYIRQDLLRGVPVDAAMLQALAEQAVYVKQQAATAPAAPAVPTAPAAPAAPASPAIIPAAVPAGAGNLIFVGDSRIGQMGSAVGGTTAFPGTAFVSCYGGGYEWLKDTPAKNSIDAYVTPGSIIIINYGVNDLSNHQEYIGVINRYAADWAKKGAAVYFATVGPVGANSFNKTNWAVEYFNNSMCNGLSGGIGRINLYGYLTSTGYTTQPDGLHYTPETYARMFNFLRSSVGRAR